MKLGLVVRIVIIVSIVLLCTGFGVYSFWRLNMAEERKDFNLYTLVPGDAVAVFETDYMAGLLDDINAMDSSQDGYYLNVSGLFGALRDNFKDLVEGLPHGLSREMNKLLISFHEPESPLNQVLYCSLGTGDYSLVEDFLQQRCSGGFPAKTAVYQGEDIRIFPLSDGRFLSAYFTRDFLAVSFQKRLIEQVIDARKHRRSLMQQSSFSQMHRAHTGVSALMYIRLRNVDMGKEVDSLHLSSRLGGWVEFDIKFKSDAIYCSGVASAPDSAHTFVGMLGQQKPVDEFPGARLPRSTFFYSSWAVSDLASALGFTSQQQYSQAEYSEYVQERDAEWLSFLQEHAAEGDMLFCLFRSKDTLSPLPSAVVSIPMQDAVQAEQSLRNLLRGTPRETGAPAPPAFTPQYARYPASRGPRRYLLPRSTLLLQLTGINASSLYGYACFYAGHLLLAPDAVSLSAYIDAIERGRVLDGMPFYEELTGSLAPSYNYTQMADMEQVVGQAETYVRLMPSLFFRQADFFRHFIAAFQFTCTEGVVYPNVVLLYKGDD